MNELHWAGSSKRDLLALPREAVREIGHQLDRVQRGLEPDDWKPLGSLGKGVHGVREIRVSDADGTYRSAYVAHFDGVVVVLHCWQKKTRATSAADKALIVQRYKTAESTFG
jgi:phage-related protein